MRFGSGNCTLRPSAPLPNRSQVSTPFSIKPTTACLGHCYSPKTKFFVAQASDPRRAALSGFSSFFHFVSKKPHVCFIHEVKKFGISTMDENDRSHHYCMKTSITGIAATDIAAEIRTAERGTTDHYRSSHHYRDYPRYDSRDREESYTDRSSSGSISRSSRESRERSRSPVRE